ncbi:ankyrin repeat [Stylonychia lemnae]|uniref:Ankyrin repeat n=1 Tax=Stylonychia lemnae TaxID=5949 RepID=A0A078AXS6_STYLE|nr:ankyrin repeat [Stylonychia lemnae]|eukprot:CDW86866.1 ankyrin repeat [Stylonychia lemnae]
MESIHNQQLIENVQQRIEISQAYIDEKESEEAKSQEWRQDLKIGDMVDVSLELPGFEAQNVWVQALIVSITDLTFLELDFIFDIWQEETLINKWSLKVAQFQRFRVQSDTGDYEDSQFGQYKGCCYKFDEWIPLNSQRIQPFLSQTLKGSNMRNKEKLLALPCSAFGTITELNSLTENGKYVDQANEYNESPLYIACLFGRFEVVEYLISIRANLNQRTDYDLSPLMAAIQEGHADIVRLLIRNGVAVNLNTKNAYFREEIVFQDEILKPIYENIDFERIKNLLMYHQQEIRVDQKKGTFKNLNKSIFRKVITEYF